MLCFKKVHALNILKKYNLGLERNRIWATDLTYSYSYVKILPKIWKMVRTTNLFFLAQWNFSVLKLSLACFPPLETFCLGFKAELQPPFHFCIQKWKKPLFTGPPDHIRYKCWVGSTELKTTYNHNWNHVQRLIHMHPSICTMNDRTLPQTVRWKSFISLCSINKVKSLSN